MKVSSIDRWVVISTPPSKGRGERGGGALRHDLAPWATGLRHCRAPWWDTELHISQGSRPPAKNHAGMIFREKKIMPRLRRGWAGRLEAGHDFCFAGPAGRGQGMILFFAGPAGLEARHDFFPQTAAKPLRDP